MCVDNTLTNFYALSRRVNTSLLGRESYDNVNTYQYSKAVKSSILTSVLYEAMSNALSSVKIYAVDFVARTPFVSYVMISLDSRVRITEISKLRALFFSVITTSKQDEADMLDRVGIGTSRLDTNTD